MISRLASANRVTGRASLAARRGSANGASVAARAERGELAVRRSWARVMWSVADLPGGLADALWNDPAELVQSGETLRQNGARRTARISWGGRYFVVKHYVEPTRRHAVKQLVESSRAAATWRLTQRLIGGGIATPRPVARVENRWGPLRQDSYLMYEYVDGVTLRQWLGERATLETPLVERLCAQCAEMWKRLVETGVSLSDPNLGNFIVGTDESLWLIDVDKSRVHARGGRARKSFRRSWDLFVRSASKSGDRAVEFVAAVASRAPVT
jgi:hypothetical protein